MPSWTLSARLEPWRLVGSPNCGVFHPGHVTPNPPWACLSLARLQCCSSLPHQALWLLKHTHTDRIREKNRMRQELWEHTYKQAESTYATCYILTVEFREGGSYNLFSLCDCISVRVILFFTHVTRKHTQGPEAQWGNHNINSARLGLDRHTCTHTHTDTHTRISCVSAQQFI